MLNINENYSSCASTTILGCFSNDYGFIYLVVNGCVLKKSRGNWLIPNGLHVAITMALKLKEDFGITPFMANIMEKYIVMVLELLMLLSTLRNKYVVF